MFDFIKGIFSSEQLKNAPRKSFIYARYIGIIYSFFAIGLLIYCLIYRPELITEKNYHFILGGIFVTGLLFIGISLFFIKEEIKIENKKQEKIEEKEKIEKQEEIQYEISSMSFWIKELKNINKGKNNHLIILAFVKRFNNQYSVKEISQFFEEAINSNVWSHFTDLKQEDVVYGIPGKGPLLNYVRRGKVSITKKGEDKLKEENIKIPSGDNIKISSEEN